MFDNNNPAIPALLMFKSRELSNLQNRVALLEKQLKESNGKAARVEAELKAATAKVQRFKAALDSLHAAIAAKASEGDEEDEPAAEGDEEDAPAGKNAKKAEGEEDAPADDEEDAPAAEGDEEDEPSAEGDEEDAPADEDEDKTMKKSKASLAILNRIPGKAALNKQVEKKAAKVVTSRLAAAGVDPVKRDPSAAEGNDGTKKPDASLPPRQRAVAAMSGFKVFSKN